MAKVPTPLSLTMGAAGRVTGKTRSDAQFADFNRAADQAKGKETSRLPPNPMPFTATERRATGRAAGGRAMSQIDVQEADRTLPGKHLGARVLNAMDVRKSPARPLSRRVARGRR